MDNFEIKKDIEVEIRIDGRPLQGTSTIFIRDGKVDYSNAEEHFYEIMRKWEKDWIKEAIEETKEKIIDNLTPEQEDLLQESHAKDYHGTDDSMSDSYEEWLCEIDYDELVRILTVKAE